MFLKREVQVVSSRFPGAKSTEKVHTTVRTRSRKDNINDAPHTLSCVATSLYLHLSSVCLFVTVSHPDLLLQSFPSNIMPVLSIQTNAPQSKVTPALVKKLVDIVADSLGKPKSFVVVHVSGSQVMSFGGGDAVAAIGRLTSIGAINKGNNEKLQANVAKILEKELGVASDKLYITLEDVAPVNIGWKHSTFADMFG